MFIWNKTNYIPLSYYNALAWLNSWISVVGFFEYVDLNKVWLCTTFIATNYEGFWGFNFLKKEMLHSLLNPFHVSTKSFFFLALFILYDLWDSPKKMGLSQCFEKRWDSPKKRLDRVKIPILVFFFPALQTTAFWMWG